jgi:2-oxoisovalerate dehydrogenase E1 component alpha subunit
VSSETVARFDIRLTRCLDRAGTPVCDLPGFAEDRDAMVAMYRAMARTRAFDARAVALQRTGQLGTFASSLGQEAVAVGIGVAMAPDDVLLPAFREQGAQFWRGVRMLDLLLYWGGDERGSAYEGDGAPREDFPVCVPVGTQAAHAAGVAAAFHLRHEARAALCVIGDGATSRGDVIEAMNVAGLWALPVVYVVNNNGWAISVPRRRQTAAKTLAQKAIAAGIPGEQVDGNDVVAVRARIEAALYHARKGRGPTVIEALTYRLSDHTTADDASRYRDDAEVSARWTEEPVRRLRDFLVAREWWGKQDEEALAADCAAEVEDAVAAYLAVGPQPPEAMFDHLFAELPEPLRRQRERLLQRAARSDA